MNSFGTIFRIGIFGESHGESIGVTIDGCPPGVRLREADFEESLARRRPGAAGTSSRSEPDRPRLISGVFRERTTGAPLTVVFENNDSDSSDYERLRNLPRPGHADFTANEKFRGFNDYRGGGHFSGRLTLGIVTAGVVAKKTYRGRVDILQFDRGRRTKGHR